MKYIHVQRFVRISPRKVRPLARQIKSLRPQDALEILPMIRKRAAIPLQKTLKAALSNAKNRGASDDLLISEIQVGEGPRLKRGRFVSRGRWHSIKKRMSHIRVVLEDKTKKKDKAREFKKARKESEKKVSVKAETVKRVKKSKKRKSSGVRKTNLKKGKEK